MSTKQARSGETSAKLSPGESGKIPSFVTCCEACSMQVGAYVAATGKRIAELEQILKADCVAWGGKEADKLHGRIANLESALAEETRLKCEYFAAWQQEKRERDQLAAQVELARKALEWTPKLIDFLTEGLEAAWQGCDWCGNEIQDKAEKLGLVESERYDPEKHSEYGSVECETGDPGYTIKPEVLKAKEALAQLTPAAAQPSMYPWMEGEDQPAAGLAEARKQAFLDAAVIAGRFAVADYGRDVAAVRIEQALRREADK